MWHISIIQYMHLDGSKMPLGTGIIIQHNVQDFGLSTIYTVCTDTLRRKPTANLAFICQLSSHKCIFKNKIITFGKIVVTPNFIFKYKTFVGRHNRWPTRWIFLVFINNVQSIPIGSFTHLWRNNRVDATYMYACIDNLYIHVFITWSFLYIQLLT